MSTSLTIGIPIYKTKLEDIQRAVKSIEDQNLSSYEILFVLDGEEYNEELIKSKFLSTIKHAKVVIQKHGGEGRARNRIIDEACGKWLLFVDADDYLLPDVVGELLAEAEEQHADVITSNHIRVYGKTEEKVHYYTKDKIWNGNESQECLKDVLSMGTDQGTVWAKIFRVSFLKEKHIYFNPCLRNGEDQEFMTRLILSKASVVNSPLYSYAYVYNENSVVRKFDTNYLDNVLKTIEYVNKDLAAYPGKIDDEVLRLYYLDRFMLVLVNYVCNNKITSYSERRRLFERARQKTIFKEAFNKRLPRVDSGRYIVLIISKYQLFFLVDIIIKIRSMFRR